MKTIRIFGNPKDLEIQYQALINNLEKDENYMMTISIPKTDRSLDQNALYWKMLSDFAKWGGQNINVLHNQILCDYGVPTGYYAIIPEEDHIEELSDIHLKRTSKTKVGKDNKVYVYCQILKGSHELRKDEMSKLIEGLKNEIIGSGADSEIDIGE